MSGYKRPKQRRKYLRLVLFAPNGEIVLIVPFGADWNGLKEIAEALGGPPWQAQVKVSSKWRPM